MNKTSKILLTSSLCMIIISIIGFTSYLKYKKITEQNNNESYLSTIYNIISNCEFIFSNCTPEHNHNIGHYATQDYIFIDDNDLANYEEENKLMVGEMFNKVGDEYFQNPLLLYHLYQIHRENNHPNSYFPSEYPTLYDYINHIALDLDEERQLYRDNFFFGLSTISELKDSANLKEIYKFDPNTSLATGILLEYIAKHFVNYPQIIQALPTYQYSLNI